MSIPRTDLRRRDILRGLRRRGPSTTGRVEGAPGPARSASDLVNVRRDAMGSFFEVRLAAHAPGAVDLASRALDVVDDLEAMLSIYREDSEVSRLNASAHLGPVPVGRELFDLVAEAIEIGEATGGAYDLASGALSIAWGFLRGPRRVPDAEALADARSRTGRHLVALDPTRRTIAFDRAGVVLNFGGIGKGHAIDRAAGVVRDHWWPTSALIHGGQSSLYALGSPPGDFGGRWSVALRNPSDPAAPLGTIRLRDRGLGTSGDSFQHFEAGGRRFGHILDPRTGVPADSSTAPASVTVLAPTAALADALSTAFALLGPAGASPVVAARPDISAIFVVGEAGRPLILTLGLGPGDFEPAPGCRREVIR